MTRSTYLHLGVSRNFTGGGDVEVGLGQQWTIKFTSSINVGQTFTLTLVDQDSGQTLQVGGDTTNILPSFCFVYDGKGYILAGSRVYMSEINNLSVWANLDAVGNGYVELRNKVGTPEDLASMSVFQGKLAFFSRLSTQIWNVAADPASWVIAQVLDNIGTIAKDSVRAKGDLDVIFLSDSGIRSLRARETSLNAYVDDLGSPIDGLIQAVIQTYPTDAARACAVIEPTTSQYWLYLKNKIYVLSAFPSAKVAGWSIFLPTDSAGLTFDIDQLIVFQGQVWAFDKDGQKLYRYGGSTRIEYDATVATWEIPWTDGGRPDYIKGAVGIQASYSANWEIRAVMGPGTVVGTQTPVWSGSSYTYGNNRIPLVGFGSHFKAKGTSVGSTAAVFSSLIFIHTLDEQL